MQLGYWLGKVQPWSRGSVRNGAPPAYTKFARNEYQTARIKPGRQTIGMGSGTGPWRERAGAVPKRRRPRPQPAPLGHWPDCAVEACPGSV